MRCKKTQRKWVRQGVAHLKLLLVYLYRNPTAVNALYILENMPPGISEIMLNFHTYQREPLTPQARTCIISGSMNMTCSL